MRVRDPGLNTVFSEVTKEGTALRSIVVGARDKFNMDGRLTRCSVGILAVGYSWSVMDRHILCVVYLEGQGRVFLRDRGTPNSHTSKQSQFPLPAPISLPVFARSDNGERYVGQVTLFTRTGSVCESRITPPSPFCDSTTHVPSKTSFGGIFFCEANVQEDTAPTPRRRPAFLSAFRMWSFAGWD